MLKIGYTLGDLGGIGPEIFEKFLKTINTEHPENSFEAILVDEVLEPRVRSSEYLKQFKIGQASAEAGEHAYQALKKASEMAKAGEIDCLITGPVCKESLSLAARHFSGQTEVLASLNDLEKEDIEMFFILDEIKVVLGTRHIPIRDVAKSISKGLPRVIKNSYQALEKIFGITKPSIAVAGLNPHAGENGLIGDEEVKHMKPFIQKFNAENPELEDLRGPLPADILFAKVAQNYLARKSQEHDLYVAAYHDQVLSMIKGIGGYKAINLTTGLPFVRVSVDHGTAYDIAGKNLADPNSLNACTEFCLKNISSVNTTLLRKATKSKVFEA